MRKYLVAFVALLFLSACSSGSGTYRDDNMHVSDFENMGDRVFFALNSSTVSASGMETLKHQAEWLKDHPRFTITAEGHADERGTREYNIALGERRATAVKAALVSMGVDASKIETISYGKERPAVIGNTEDAYAQNRRGVTAIR